VSPNAATGQRRRRDRTSTTCGFANNEAAKGWDEMCRQAPGNTRAAFEAIRANPCPVPSTKRHHRLKYELAWGTHNGMRLEQWQYEVTGGGRIWYLINYDTRTVWLVYALGVRD
jgi:hypothetical protein